MPISRRTNMMYLPRLCATCISLHFAAAVITISFIPTERCFAVHSSQTGIHSIIHAADEHFDMPFTERGRLPTCSLARFGDGHFSLSLKPGRTQMAALISADADKYISAAADDFFFHICQVLLSQHASMPALGRFHFYTYARKAVR